MDEEKINLFCKEDKGYFDEEVETDKDEVLEKMRDLETFLHTKTHSVKGFLLKVNFHDNTALALEKVPYFTDGEK